MALLDPTEALERPLRVVAIGGGTGLSTLLRGLKQYVPIPRPAQKRRGRRSYSITVSPEPRT